MYRRSHPRVRDSGYGRNGTKGLTYTLVYSKKLLTLSVETAITTHLRIRTPLNNPNPNQNNKPQNKTL